MTPSRGTFDDPAVPGTVEITKEDDAGNLLDDAEFTLYENNAPLAGPRGNEDTITTKTCTTGATALRRARVRSRASRLPAITGSSRPARRRIT